MASIKRGEIEAGSLGEFTGWLDVKGNEIYEGDIVRARTLEEYEVIAFIGEFVLDGHYEQVTYKTFATVGNEVEVIGNTHDNPEIFYCD